MRGLLLILVFASVMGAGILLAGSITWLRHGQPEHYREDIESSTLSTAEVKEKKWLKFEADKEYFYQHTVEYTLKRGTFPFLELDTAVVDPKTVWTKPRHNH